MTEQLPERTPHGYLFGKQERLSEASIWGRHRAFYSTMGVDAWNNNTVPHYVTNNPNTTYAYAQVLFAFLRDYARTNPAADEPIYILELGAGTGRFAYHLLHQLTEFIKHAGFDVPKFCYILADLAETSLDFYSNHSKLQPYIADGMLDYTVFDAENDRSLSLRISGKTLGVASLKHPLIVLGNYFFDSILQDAFYADEGELFELYLEQYTEEPIPDGAEPSADTAITYVFQRKPIEPTTPYDDPVMAQILAGYQEELYNANFTFPYLGIGLLEQLQTWSQRGLFLMTVDKGYHHISHMHGRHPPRIDPHGTAMSITVNFNALTQYFTLNGYDCLTIDHHHGHIDTVCILLMPEAESKAFQETRLAYQQFVNLHGADDFFAFKKFYESRYDEMTFKHLLALLRIVRYDPHIFNSCIPRLIELMPGATYNQLNDLAILMTKSWDLYYPIGEANAFSENIRSLNEALMERYQ